MSLLQTAVTRLRGLVVCLLVCGLSGQAVFADSITYRQLQQDQSRQVATVASTPKVARSIEQQNQGQGQYQQEQQQGGAAQESASHPEFVRLPDGRIVRYGPGIICEENCVEPIAPAAFRGPGPALWWIIPPIVAGGVLCAVLCRPDRDSNPQPSPTIVIPPPSPQVSPTISPSPAPSSTPPPTQIPEPGTLLLFGAGLGALLTRKRMAAKKEQGN